MHFLSCISDNYVLFVKASQTGTHCSLQYCYVTQCNHILVFIQGAKEASQRDSSRGPYLWQRLLIKLSLLDQTVQYRYITQQLLSLHLSDLANMHSKTILQVQWQH